MDENTDLATGQTSVPSISHCVTTESHAVQPSEVDMLVLFQSLNDNITASNKILHNLLLDRERSALKRIQSESDRPRGRDHEPTMVEYMVQNLFTHFEP